MGSHRSGVPWTAVPAPFHSVLFDRPGYRTDVAGREHPDFFADLNLDQVVKSITAGREDYDLTRFFYTPLDSIEAIAYRHAILRDLKGKPLSENIASFAQKMRAMRDHLSQAAKLHYRYQQETANALPERMTGDGA